MIRYEPGEIEATTNEAVKVPPEIVQLSVVTIVPLSAHEVSLGEKPVPVTETAAPTGADVGLKVTDAEELDVPTVNVAEAESLSGLPVAVMVYVLTPTAATVNEPVNVPAEIEHVSDNTGVPISEQEESAALNPVPDTSTTAPGSAEDGLNVIWSPLSPTVRIADAESSLGKPVTATAYSEAATFATTNDADKEPPEIEHVYVLAPLLMTSQLVSAVEKPEPETTTVVPTAADEGDNVMVREDVPVIVKTADAESPPGLPTTLIVYVPAPVVATVNVPDNVPPEMMQV